MQQSVRRAYCRMGTWWEHFGLEACRSLIAHLVVLPSPQGLDGRGPVEPHPDDGLQDFGVNLDRKFLHDYTANLHTEHKSSAVLFGGGSGRPQVWSPSVWVGRLLVVRNNNMLTAITWSR
jgi:hypothetical protein